MHLGMSLAPRLEMRHELKPYLPHSPIKNPDITAQINTLVNPLTLEEIASSNGNDRKIPLSMEKRLFEAYPMSKSWTNYLDTPLIAHADAAVKLSQFYDGVVGIKDAGLAYSEIFRMMGFSVEEIDYSHHKRNMDSPVISDDAIDRLKQKDGVLLTDIDVVTGKTIQEVYKELTSKGVRVEGVYIGLSKWPGMNIQKSAVGYTWKVPTFGTRGIGFRNFWNKNNEGLWTMNEDFYEKGVVPEDFVLYGPNGDIESGRDAQKKLAEASRRVAYHILNGDKNESK